MLYRDVISKKEAMMQIYKCGYCLNKELNILLVLIAISFVIVRYCY